ncbi:hypothetical protein AC230_24850 [Streptomyces caatingaensis]|uniref:Uncharacterized protein n=1 Tax=Streptomyces caatingaensis TaxID=1678637 RepID=A0A0K9XA27_9ACTN|nr:hypothetical protein AC230_24850 [Streptomyces caatingaensis]
MPEQAGTRGANRPNCAASWRPVRAWGFPPVCSRDKICQPVTHARRSGILQAPQPQVTRFPRPGRGPSAGQ